MNLDHHERFQHMIDESLVGILSIEKEHSLREHLATCASCTECLIASNRVIAGLGGFSFEVNPTLNARILATLAVQAKQADHSRTLRPYSVPFKHRVAFAAALSVSFVGSGLVYQIAERLAGPMHIDSSRVLAGVLVFWLLPSICAAFCVLAVPGWKRGLA